MFICPNLPPLANLVKYQEIQEKLLLEIKGAAGDGDESVKRMILQEMSYLKSYV